MSDEIRQRQLKLMADMLTLTRLESLVHNNRLVIRYVSSRR